MTLGELTLLHPHGFLDVEPLASDVADHVEGQDGEEHDGAGISEIHHSPVCSGFLPSMIMKPHVGVGGRTDRPRKASAPSATMSTASAGEGERQHRWA